MAIVITTTHRNDLRDWLVNGGDCPTWLDRPGFPIPCIYILQCKNNLPCKNKTNGNYGNDAYSTNNNPSKIIPCDGYSVKVGSSTGGICKAIYREYIKGPHIGGTTPILIDALQYIRVIDPDHVPGHLTLTQARTRVRIPIWAFIDGHFSVVPSPATTWKLYRTGSGDPVDMIAFLDSIDPAAL
ncbi:MAG TPA: hypothetical protein EYN89_04410 [Flavobacteriales bacterium]|nr:hypothetical protein [Flavobacteriales bacterium]